MHGKMLFQFNPGGLWHICFGTIITTWANESSVDPDIRMQCSDNFFKKWSLCGLLEATKCTVISLEIKSKVNKMVFFMVKLFLAIYIEQFGCLLFEQVKVI